MKSLTLVSKSDQKYKVSIPEPMPGLVSAYIFAFAKSGSTLLDNMVSAYCHEIGVPTFSLYNTAFDQGVLTQEIDSDAVVCFQKTGCIYTGFRHFPFFNLDVHDAPTILLVRDPRDMIVSMYYSILKSHVIPRGISRLAQNREDAEQLDINEFVVQNIGSYVAYFRRYKEALARSDLTVYRYEDVIYQKKKWLSDVVVKLGLEQHPKRLSAIAKRFDVIPITENQNEHIRQVHPGNHKRKLSNQTIQELNQSLSDFLEYFDYAP